MKSAQELLALGLTEWQQKAIDAGLMTQNQVDSWHQTLDKFPNHTQKFKVPQQTHIIAWK